MGSGSAHPLNHRRKCLVHLLATHLSLVVHLEAAPGTVPQSASQALANLGNLWSLFVTVITRFPREVVGVAVLAMAIKRINPIFPALGLGLILSWPSTFPNTGDAFALVVISILTVSLGTVAMGWGVLTTIDGDGPHHVLLGIIVSFAGFLLLLAGAGAHV